MTVKEFREKLENMPDNMTIVALTEDGEIDADVVDVSCHDGAVAVKLVI